MRKRDALILALFVLLAALDAAAARAQDASPAAPPDSADLADSPPVPPPAPIATSPDLEPAARDETEPSASGTRAWVAGRIELRYELRSTDGSDREDDQDFEQHLFIEGGRGEHARFELSGTLHEDMDGRGQPGTFRDAWDTWGHAAHGYLYTAHGDLCALGPLLRLRLGRQVVRDGIGVRFDGALAESEVLGDALKVWAYGGIPAHLYETSVRGDWLAGVSMEFISLPRTRVRFDYVHLTDEREDLDDRQQEVDRVARDDNRDDDLFQLTIVHMLARELRLLARASTFEGRSTRLEADALYLDPDRDITARARYVYQMGSYRDLSISFTPLDEVLDPYEPYHEVLLRVRKGLADHFALGAGATFRQLVDDREDGPFNHEFQRYWCEVELYEWPWAGFSASFLADWYIGSDVEDRTFQGAFDVRQEIGPFAASVGTAYALYDFDELFLVERERVRTYFARIEWRPARAIRAGIGYEYEEDEEDRYHAVRCEVRHEF